MPTELDRIAALSRDKLDVLRQRLASARARRPEPIALVGVGCRLPGASSLEELGALLDREEDRVGRVPADRWDPSAYGPDISPHGAFLDDVYAFDPGFFGLSPREALHLDPQGRLLLEVAWSCLEDAACPPSRLAGARVGVFVGASTSDHLLRSAASAADVDRYTGTGNAHSILANRLSYQLDLRGPSVAIDTACSSSLVAVHLAAASLASGECDAALAGGVNLMLSPHLAVAFSRAGMMAADGRCKTFDARADGYVRGEGAGVVLLKRYVDAVADGDRVYAVILGGAVNQDGRSNGLTAPNGAAQRRLLEAALHHAGLPADAVGYLEAHGTGTSLGDPIEVAAVRDVYGGARTAPLAIGSVKSNLGHLEAAAGIAGLLKATLAVGRGRVYRTLHFEHLNPRIDLAGTSIEVAAAARDWTDARGRVAGVSAFGFGGTNAHLLLAEPPTQAPPARSEPPYVLPLSAHTPEALATARSRLIAAWEERPELHPADIAHTLARGRAPLPHRLAVAGVDRDDLLSALRKAAAVAPGGTPKVAFVFTGQGSQRAGMGLELHRREPAFRNALDAVAAHADPLLGRSLLGVLDDEAALGQTRWAQPALLAVGYALSALWRSWGVEPAVRLGHSLGELVAALDAGVMSLPDAVRVAVERGRRMQALPDGGAMAAVRVAEEALEPLLAAHPGACVAARNAPSHLTITGDADAVDAVCAAVRAGGGRAVRLDVSHAFHSPRMDPMLDGFRELLGSVPLHAPAAPLLSNLTGAREDARFADPGYWVRQIREPVRFADMIRAAVALGCTHFLELGATPALSVPGRATHHAPWLASLHRGRSEAAQLRATLAELWSAGVAVDWERAGGSGRPVSLPLPAWQRTPLVLPPSELRGAPVWTRRWVPAGRAGPAVEPDRTARSSAAFERATLFASGDGGGRDGAAGRPGADDNGASDAEKRGDEPGGDARVGEGPWRVEGDAEALRTALGHDVTARNVVYVLPHGEGPEGVLPVLGACRERGAALWLVTTSATPEAAAARGLVRSVHAEEPTLVGGIFDAAGVSAAALAQALRAGGELERRAHAGGWQVPRLQPASVAPAAISGGPWLVSGGLGALGLAAAGALVDAGVRELILLGRSGTGSDAARGAVAALERRGARVLVLAADVRDEERIHAALGETVLEGVIHAAGVASRVPAAALGEADMTAALAPKLDGARALDRIARRHGARYFVLTSSVSALWGSPLLAHYAAANAALDAVAEARRAEGLHAQVMWWGPWAAGMTRPEEAATMATLGLRAFSPAVGAQRLRAHLGGEDVLLADVDWPRFLGVMEARGPRPFFEALRAIPPSAPPAPAAAARQVTRRDRGAILATLQEEAKDVLRTDGLPDPARGLFELGLDSLMAMELAARVRARLDVDLPVTALFDRATLADVADLVLEQLGDRRSEALAAPVAADGPVAVVGLACRLPGGCDTPEDLWRLLLDQRDTVGPAPPGRFAEAVPPGGWLADVGSFDADFFRISPREAARMDPQHRLLLEVAWEALDRSGQGQGSEACRTGVFVGIGSADYLHEVVARAPVDAWTGTGNAAAFAAGRLAYHLGLRGPALALDTACSSSLVATHLACQSLRAGECDLALAGGVSLMLSPRVHGYLEEAGALSPDGRCKTFDAAADGYGRGEGCGIVVLKRLADATRDGDTVLAVIAGSAVNHDGPSSGLTVPSGAAQRGVLRAALDRAGLAPGDVDYVEAHGTGTSLGDPIEATALDAVLGAERDGPLLVGTVKTNLGHLEAAAGIAGLQKAILAISRGTLPASLHYRARNPHLPPPERVEVVAAARSWPRARRRAGVSAFGLSGTNAHVLVEDAPPAVQGEAPLVLLLTAHTEPALAALRDQVGALLARSDDAAARALCAGAAGRRLLPWRLSAAGADVRALVDALRAATPSRARDVRVSFDVEGAPTEVYTALSERGGAPVTDAAGLRGVLAAWGLQADEGEGAERLVVGPGDTWSRFVGRLAALVATGANVRWDRVFAGARRTPLPNLPFQRRRHWLATPERGVFPGEATRVPSARLTVHTTTLRPSGWLEHHRLFGAVVTPGAAWLAWALAAHPGRNLSELRFERTLVLADEAGPRAVQLVRQGDAWQVVGDPEGEGVIHARGLVGGPVVAAEGALLDAARARCPRPSSPDFYARFAALGYTLGPSFRWIGETWTGEGEAVCRLAPDAGTLAEAGAPLHPGLLDSCFQLLTRCLPPEEAERLLDGTALFVPVALRSAALVGTAAPAWCHARLVRTSAHEQEADLVLHAASGGVVARLDGLVVRRIPASVLLPTRRLPAMGELAWRPVPGEPLQPDGAWAVLGGPPDLAADLESRLPTGPGQERRVFLALEPMDLVPSCLALLDAVRALPRGGALWLVTRGAAELDLGPRVDRVGGALRGLLRSLSAELSGVALHALDLDPGLPVEPETVLRELSDLPDVVVRGGARLAARVEPAPPPLPDTWAVVQERVFDLESLAVRPDGPPDAPGPGEVRVRVRAVALNFRDVLGAMGAYPGDPGPLGGECAGVIDAVGDGVAALRVGDRVVAMLARTGCMRSHAVVDARFVVPLPDGLSFAEAASLPVAWVTARHALVGCAGLRPGERVLVHSATGGVGLAAVAMARSIGAEVVGTAGSEAKRARLRDVTGTRAYDSRSLAYEAELAATGGVDVVLNALGPEHIRAGIRLLRPGGRFVEIGKAEILPSSPRADTSYRAFDLVALSQEDPALVATLLREAMAEAIPGPIRAFPVERAAEAFRGMARGGHIGKLVLEVPEPPATVPTDGTWLVTGGLGALGLLAADWLVERGVRSLVLASRRTRPAPDRVLGWRTKGVDVEILPLDVADEPALAALAARRRVVGVVHAAGVRGDALAGDIDASTLRSALRPKVAGTDAILAALPDLRLGLFYSSAAAVLGSPGQSAYAAANAWMDARARAGAGARLCSIAWGPWTEGMTETLDPAVARRWRALGIEPIRPEDTGPLLDEVLRHASPALVALPMDLAALARAPAGRLPPRLRDAAAPAPPPGHHGARPVLDPADPASLLGFLQSELRAVLELGPDAPVDPDRLLSDLGVDSLMAVEVTARLEGALDLDIPAAALAGAGSLRALASDLGARLTDRGLPPVSPAASAAPAPLAAPTATPAPLPEFEEFEL